MIKNDYVLTHGERTQGHLDNLPSDQELRRNENSQRGKQLADVLSGKQGQIPLSNLIWFLTQKYINNIANDATMSKEKRSMMTRHLSYYADKIPLYLRKNS